LTFAIARLTSERRIRRSCRESSMWSISRRRSSSVPASFCINPKPHAPAAGKAAGPVSGLLIGVERGKIKALRGARLCRRFGWSVGYEYVRSGSRLAGEVAARAGGGRAFSPAECREQHAAFPRSRAALDRAPFVRATPEARREGDPSRRQAGRGR